MKVFFFSFFFRIISEKEISNFIQIIVVELNNEPCQFLYSQDDVFHFLNSKTMETLEIDENLIDSHTKKFLLDGTEVKIQVRF